jgi:hypothetical protein
MIATYLPGHHQRIGNFFAELPADLAILSLASFHSSAGCEEMNEPTTSRAEELRVELT